MTLTRKKLIIVDLFKKNYNAKITKVESKIPIITGLAVTAALNAVENKIRNIMVMV